MTLLTYARDVCDEIGIEPPSSIVNNDDDDARRLLSLFKSEGLRLSRRYDWQEVVTEITFPTVAAEDQGLVTALADDFDRMIKDTMFNRSDRRQRLGSVSPQSWQADKARGTNNLRYTFRLRGGHLLMNPVPGAGETVAFEYVSNKWVRGSDGTPKTSFTADSDTVRIDADLLKLGVKWRYQKAIGGDWQGDFQEYREQLKLRFGVDNAQGIIDMGGNGNLLPGDVRITKD
ncbi:hypothetical protein CFBP5875_04660 [Agrobacterium pusense]|nr:hypothetical protein [Agrobacterium pusense]QCL83910.1 hypothetical protein CFBP5875_04660 [Agrobacterium pusense]